jgi:hypothetical protein
MCGGEVIEALAVKICWDASRRLTSRGLLWCYLISAACRSSRQDLALAICVWAEMRWRGCRQTPVARAFDAHACAGCHHSQPSRLCSQCPYRVQVAHGGPMAMLGATWAACTSPQCRRRARPPRPRVDADVDEPRPGMGMRRQSAGSPRQSHRVCCPLPSDGPWGAPLGCQPDERGWAKGEREDAEAKPHSLAAVLVWPCAGDLAA